MSLAGTRLGAYEIVASLGAGGMGEVYRARDTKLGREVAIKVLPAAFAADPERLARFEREARVLASLNHPHIAQIYGVEESGALTALVLELVEGEPLSERLRKGALPVADALSLARQIAEALDAAHERGIVHRDLKPANIVVAHDGTVKVLDFGLAKAGETGGSAGVEGLTHSPTMMGPTMAGVLLGTAPYMSPEQARGKTVDKRTDIWAFGCVLYEMLTGRRAFPGETSTDTIAAILEREPDWRALPASTPAHVARLLRRCLDKDPKSRLRDIGDVSFELQPAVAGSDAVEHVPRSADTTRRGRGFATGAAVGAAIAGLAALAFVGSRRNPDVPAWARESATFAVEAATVPGAPAGLPSPGISVSRDGRSIIWTAEGPAGRPGIWSYTVSSGETRMLPGTEGALNPFWSPDGRAIAFMAEAKLKIIDAASGAIRVIAAVPEVSAGGTWSTDGVIVYAARYALMQISAAGGTPKVVGGLNRTYHENSVRHPRFLPDQRHFLYVARSGRSEESGAYVGSLDGTSVRLFDTTSHVTYAPPGYLLYARDGALVARTFDARTFAVGAETLTVLNRVGANAGGMNGHYDVSPSGVLAYFRNSTAAKAVLRWFDRSGQPREALTEPAAYSTFRLAPDDTRVAVDVESERVVGRDVWILNAAGSAPTRVTFGGTDDWQPFWSPDGRRVAFMTYRNGVSDLYVKTLTGTTPEEPLVTSDAQKTAGDFSPDGRSVAYWVESTDTRGDVFVSSLDSAREPIAVARTSANERRPRFSPDSRFVAYDSDESGRSEVYVQPFPPTGGKWQVSVGGGNEVSWRRDGRELYYVNPDGMLMAVPVTLAANAFSAGAAAPLFSVGRRGGTGGTSRYEPASDGRRFLVRQIVNPPPQPLMVTLNWPAVLNR
jgi:Tol biopolymer transport system component